MAKLVVIGNAGVELHVPHYESSGAGGLSVVEDLFHLVVGGAAVHTSTVASRLGISTAVVGVLGDDFMGQNIKSSLQAEKVDTKRLRLVAGESTPVGLTQIDADGNERRIFQPGVNRNYQFPPNIHRIPCEMFHLAAPERLTGIWPVKAAELVRLLKTSKRKVTLDICASGNGRAATAQHVKEHRPLLELVEIAFMNEHEACLISGRAERDSVLNYFHERGVQEVVVKQGEKGALVSWQGGIQSLPAPRVNAVDTTGAGDSFVAGYLAGRLQGLGPAEAVSLGCTLGGLCVRAHGPLNGTADPTLLRKALAQYRLRPAPAR